MGRPRSLVHGFGVNDANYQVAGMIGDKLVFCPAYRAWSNMIKRCYSLKSHLSRPTYIGVVVCEEWKSFMSFRSWWLDNQVEGWHLDKDLVGDGIKYSPENCIYIPAWLNTFTVDRGSARGEWPIGVCFDKNAMKFKAECRNPETRVKEYIGYFDSPYAAHQAWLDRKLELALKMRCKMDVIDRRIYYRVVDIINKAK